MILIHVEVNRNQNPHDVLQATGFKLYADDDVVEIMPKGDGSEVDVVFFEPRLEAYNGIGIMSSENLEKEYEFVGLKPADPYSLAKVNENDPSFAAKYPNGTQWKDANGNWYHVSFGHWSDNHRTDVIQFPFGWGGWRWFAGICK